jgi:aspartate aminotransferase
MQNISLSERVINLKQSATIEMANKAAELKAQGKPVISMTLGEPDFDTPDLLKKAAVEAIDQNYSHYPPVPGYLDAREAVCEKYARENQLDFKPSQVLLSNGAKHSLVNIALALLNSGDEVILPAPYWVSYKDMVGFVGGKVHEITTDIDSDFKMTPDQLELALKRSPKMVLFSNPCNPSGSVYTKAELSELVKVFERYPKVWIVSDEIYEYISYTDQWCSMGSFNSLKERLILVNGLSKGFAATGWRLGVTLGPEAVIKACTKIQGQTTSGANSVAQRAVIAAFKTPKSDFSYMVEAFQKRRDLLINHLRAIEGLKVNLPLGAFYAFPDVSAFFGTKTANGTLIKDSKDISMYLLNTALVGTTHGTPFGADKNIRLSYALGEADIIEAAGRIQRALAELK